jgi:hypothetical protein
MIPYKIQIETRVYAVSETRKEGRKTVNAGSGKVFLQREGESPFISDWPLKLHGETYYKEFTL